MTSEIRVKGVLEKIRTAAERAGRDPASVQLVAVSKTQPAEVVAELAGQGITLFGESRVQEAELKIPKLTGLRWHFIGHLQRNKARKAVELFEMIHSVDSLRLANTLDRLGSERSEPIEALVEVRIGGEQSKRGVNPADLPAFLQQLAGREGLRIRGLMTIPPPVARPDEQRPAFQRLAELARQIKLLEIPAVSMQELSMGMSSDYEVAIEEGATIVRVGTALFGPRRPWPPVGGGQPT